MDNLATSFAPLVLVPCLAALTFYSLKLSVGIQPTTANFFDGLVMGATFYLIIPLWLSLFGYDLFLWRELRVPQFDFVQDYYTTANILLGWSIVLGLAHFNKRKVAPQSPHPQATSTRAQPAAQVLWIATGLYLLTSIAVFILSGKSAGGHWAELADAASGNAVFVIIGNFQNVYRLALFSILIALFSQNSLNKKNAAIIGGVFALADLAITFNRISVVYYLIALLIIIRPRPLIALVTALVAAPIVTSVSSTWTIFRGMALMYGLNMYSISSAAALSIKATSRSSTSIPLMLNSLFESSNIAVFNYVVKAVPDNLTPLWGSTYIVRSITFWLPNAFWPDKPKPFGMVLGKYIQNHNFLALNSTLFGECYANFYYLWPLAFAASLFVVGKLFDATRSLGAAYPLIGFFTGFAMWRFGFSFSVIALFVVAVTAAILVLAIPVNNKQRTL